ncbi:MAG: glycosyltransferase [bacterium]|nr:glycosyltransferase [bacterium]
MPVAYAHTGRFPSPSPSFTFAAYNAMALAYAFNGCHFYIRRNSPLKPAEIIRSRFGFRPPSNLDVHAVSGPSWLPAHFWHIRRVQRSLAGLIRSGAVDAVIARNPVFLPMLKSMREEFGIPVYFESHDFYADLSVRDDVDPSRKRRLERLERENIPGLTGLICLQESQKEWYAKTFPGVPVHVARTGLWKVDSGASSPRELIYIGSLDSHKGVDLMLRAAARSETRPPVRIIGGKTAAEVRIFIKRASEIAAGLNVTVTGWLDRTALENCLSGAALGALPLRDTFFNRFLTSPLKLFDYFGHGIPVLAADLPTMRELVREDETGLFFPPGNEASMADAIDRFFSQRDRWQVMRENVLKTAAEWTWEKRARRIRAIVESDLRHPSGPEPGGVTVSNREETGRAS